MLLIIDNYDSFTYNLAQYFQILGQTVTVYANNQITLHDIQALDPTAIVISPGPNAPEQAGISLEVINTLYQQLPILGICLGHQCIAQAFGATIIRASKIIHGKTSLIHHQQQRLFRDVPTPFRGTRYHSLIIDPTTLPPCFTVDAWTDDAIMAISHDLYPIYGVQFHPEATLTEHGLQLLKNFLHQP